MTETPAPYGKQDHGKDNYVEKYNDQSWAIDYSEQDKRFRLRVIDYHAQPLELSLNQLTAMAGTSNPEDRIPRDPLIGINKGQKALYIAIDEGWSGLIEISRKDLYRFGKQMNKRSKLRQRSLVPEKKNGK